MEALDPAGGAFPRRLDLQLVNVAANGRDGDALQRITAALEKAGTRNLTTEKIVNRRGVKDGDQRFREIIEAAMRAGAAGDPNSWLAP